MRRHLPFCEFPWVLVALVTGVVGCGRGLLEDPGAVSTPESPRAAGADGGVTAPTGRDAPAGAGAADAAAPDGASAPDAPGEVAPRPAALTAVFDATLRAPACRTVGASCDSGGLIEGRAGLGPEKNGPNTIYGACADGTRGQYGVDRSIEHLRVSTEDGSLLAPGKTARLELTVTACNCDDSLPDVLGLYLARDATDPSWIPLNVLTAGPLPGRQMLTATFTVPSGKLEAVRATITKGPFPPVCDALGGTTNPGTAESDDLVFAVDHDGPDFVYLWPEAETAVLTTPLVVNSGSFSSGDAFVQVPAGRNSLAAPPADGHAVLSFSVPAARSYRLWGRALAQSTSENSFWVRIDGGPFVKWDDLQVMGGWHWQRVQDSDHGGQPLPLDLAAGAHKLELAYREQGALLDRLLITDDPLLDPSKAGEQRGPPPTPVKLAATRSQRGVSLRFETLIDDGTREIKVRRGTTPGGPYPVRFEDDSPNSFDDDTVKRGTRYCYVLQASNGAGDSPPTPEACLVP